eukprot:gene34556-57350_t
MDEYVDYIGLLSAAVLLHREDLIPRLHQLLAGTDFDEADLLIEELLNFCLPGRPIVDQWFWDKPYGMLVEVIDSETSAAKVNAMKKYVKKWYSSMKGQAHLWGKHEKTTPEYSQYVGYWAFCAAAFTYLYDLDDSTYRLGRLRAQRATPVGHTERRGRSGPYREWRDKIVSATFSDRRRQPYIDETSFLSTI